MPKPHKKFGAFTNINHTGDLRRRLISEITGLERQVHALKAGGDTVDRSMMSSYNELINSRKSLLQKLPTSWCW
ncbi:MAG TPA: hypothetical protein VIC08_02675 [Cellvibrionaceae bacterium]